MIGSTRQVAVHAYAEPVDMRKSFDTLGALVVEAMRKPLLSGDVYLFVGKTRTRARALYFDDTGLCLFSKCLEKGRFAAPWEAGEGPLRWTVSELALFLEGSDAVGRRPLSPPVFQPGERALRFG